MGARFRGGCGIVEFVDCCIMGIVRARTDWRDVEWPQVAMHRNCHLFSSPCIVHRMHFDSPLKLLNMFCCNALSNAQKKERPYLLRNTTFAISFRL